MYFQNIFKQVVSISAVAFLATTYVARAQTTKPDDKSNQWKAVEDAMERPGKLQPDGTFKFSMPRKDMKVTVDGIPFRRGWRSGHGRHSRERVITRW